MCQVFLKKCNNFITKCDIYFKMRQLLQNATFTTKGVGTSLSKTEADLKKVLKGMIFEFSKKH